jgi:ribonuclease D
VEKGYNWIGVDVEHSKTFSYTGIVCLVQLTVFDGTYHTFLIDTLKLDRQLLNRHLGSKILGCPGITKVLHGCIFSDLWWLARDFGVALFPVFDT